MLGIEVKIREKGSGWMDARLLRSVTPIRVTCPGMVPPTYPPAECTVKKISQTWSHNNLMEANRQFNSFLPKCFRLKTKLIGAPGSPLTEKENKNHNADCYI